MAAHLKYKSGSSWVDYNLVVWPVGVFYISYSSTSPASLFGGTWTPVTTGVLRAKAANNTAGSDSQTLNLSHSHWMTLAANSYRSGTSTRVTNWEYTASNGIAYTNGGSVPVNPVATDLSSNELPSSAKKYYSPNTTGHRTLGNVTVSHLPQYQNVYCWRRTA